MSWELPDTHGQSSKSWVSEVNCLPMSESSTSWVTGVSGIIIGTRIPTRYSRATPKYPVMSLGNTPILLEKLLGSTGYHVKKYHELGIGSQWHNNRHVGNRCTPHTFWRCLWMFTIPLIPLEVSVA